MNSKIIVICGPTAVGKTSFAIKLAEQFNGEIVSADSMQIYRYMDIGTAKPTPDERSIIPHHLIDIADPNEPFDAARFVEVADKKIAEIASRKKLPFVVGGTGLYIKSLIYGLFENSPHSASVRESLKKIAEKKGVSYLYQQLQKVDPLSSEKINENDAYRVIRALEIYHLTGTPISQLHHKHGFKEKRYDALKLCLTEDRTVLYQRINQRVDQMIKDGFLKEIQWLLNKGFSSSMKSMSSIGYKHIASFIEGKVSLEDATEKMKRDTRRYAKRQLTWFRKDPDILWINSKNKNEVAGKITSFLEPSSN